MKNSNPLKYFNDKKAKRVAEVVKAQKGAEVTPGQKAEARRDSLYNAAKAKTKAKLDSMMNEVQKVNAPKGSDTARVGSVRITVAKKKMGGSTKKKC
jgi:hypothetical protein